MTTISTNHPPRRYERGGVSWVTLLILAAMVGTAYLAIVWAPIYVVHYEVKQTVREYMNQAVREKDDAKLVENLCHKLRTLHSTSGVGEDGRPVQIPSVQVTPEEITWERDIDAKTLHVSFEYTRQVTFPFLSSEPREWVGTIDFNHDIAMPDWGPSR